MMPRAREVTAAELREQVRPYREVRDRILAACRALEPVRESLARSIGRVLAEDVRSDLDVPSFDSSALDGFAIRSSGVVGASMDAPAPLRVVGSVRAGDSGGVSITGSNEAVTIATGAPIPAGADAVIGWEDTSVASGADAGSHVDVHRAVAPGGSVRPRAEDLARGDVIVTAGTELGPLHVAALAAAGVASIRVVPAPRVAVLSTGDELVAPGGVLEHGQRHDANSTLMAALVQQLGATLGDCAALADDPDVIATWLQRVAATHDVIIATGGASVGRHDWLRHVIEQHGSIDVWRAAIKPGKPIAFGEIVGTPIFALPGNPASVVVSMHVFVAPFLRTLAGRAPIRIVRTTTLSVAHAGDADRVVLCPCRIEAGVATPIPTGSSQVLSTYARADALIEIPLGGARAGDLVELQPLRTEMI